MQILIIAVGKIKDKYLEDGIAEYSKRLRPYLKLKILEIPEEKRTGHLTPSDQKRIREAEGIRILRSIPMESVIIALVIDGVHWSSETLAENLRQYEIAGRNPLTIIIGGDLGLADAVIARSTVRLSISPMTFTHQMIRLIILEQIFRACKINHNEPYHK
ncbi:MAG: 23S rRNA (pseudouridine(1915)-N(3))-methyltransferase RlmH [Methanoregula sp.]|nr:23S rRNA (pseudouridine(1915)-N(3))-methyltransferase RlmH [Methanoregula sp.]